MALSFLAQKLQAYLNLYKITGTEYARRINGQNDNEYNFNWFSGDFSSAQGGKARIPASPQNGVFRDALAELVDGGY